MIRTISPLPQPLSHWERGAGTPEFSGFLPLLPLGEGGWGVRAILAYVSAIPL